MIEKEDKIERREGRQRVEREGERDRERDRDRGKARERERERERGTRELHMKSDGIHLSVSAICHYTPMPIAIETIYL